MLNERIIRGYSLSVYMNDLNRTINSKAIFNQKDVKTAVLIVQLLNNKTEKSPIDLTGTTVIAKVLKNDGTTSLIYCSVLNPTLGTVAVGFTEQTLLSIGENSFELEIQSGYQVVYSPKISYTVVDNLFDEEELLTSQDEFPVLNSLIYNVQLLEQELVNLDSIVNEGEEVRNSNEEQRKENEVQRGTEFDNIKSTIQEKVNLINQKIEEIDNLASTSETKIDEEIVKINGSVNLKISEINNKIAETNNKLLDVDNSIVKINTTITENIKKVDSKIQEVNNLISSVNSTFAQKVSEVDSKIQEFETEVDNSIRKIETESTKINNNLTSSINLKISEVDNKSTQMESKVNQNISSMNTKVDQHINSMNNNIEQHINSVNTNVEQNINSMNTKVNQHVELITEKISNYDEKINIMENLTNQVNSAEETRNRNEIERNNTIQSIVEVLEVSLISVCEIMNMV